MHISNLIEFFTVQLLFTGIWKPIRMVKIRQNSGNHTASPFG